MADERNQNSTHCEKETGRYERVQFPHRDPRSQSMTTTSDQLCGREQLGTRGANGRLTSGQREITTVSPMPSSPKYPEPSL